MNFRALQYFVKLAELKHFSKAAEACFVSQPTLSTQIRKLEEELGITLVERAPRKVMLTAAGEDIAHRARHILRDIDHLKDAARRSKDPETGTIKLGIFPTLAPYLLPHIIPGIRKRYPELRLQLAEEKTEDILRMLDQGRLDAGLLALPIEDQGMEIKILFEEPFVMAMPSSHPLSDKQSIGLQDLEGAELLLLEEGHCLRQHALAVCKLAGAHERVDFSCHQHGNPATDGCHQRRCNPDARAVNQTTNSSNRQYHASPLQITSTQPNNSTGLAKKFTTRWLFTAIGRKLPGETRFVAPAVTPSLQGNTPSTKWRRHPGTCKADIRDDGACNTVLSVLKVFSYRSSNNSSSPPSFTPSNKGVER